MRIALGLKGLPYDSRAAGRHQRLPGFNPQALVPSLQTATASQRVLGELGLPYEIKHYQRDKHDARAARAARGASAAVAPVITDGEATAAESGAIIEYLFDRHGNGRLRPAPGTPGIPAVPLLAALCRGRCRRCS